jgi:toxin FitB
MYLLDTNVISEARRKNPYAVRWIESTDSKDHFICAVSLGEISTGAHRLNRSDKARAAVIFDWLGTLVSQFQDRIVNIDQDVAMEWGRIAAIRTRGEADGLIAAAAIVNDLTIVTRNVRDFADTGVRLINPWAEA